MKDSLESVFTAVGQICNVAVEIAIGILESFYITFANIVKALLMNVSYLPFRQSCTLGQCSMVACHE